MIITSSIFEDGKVIPTKYGYNFENINPPLSIKDVPSETKSLLLIMDDPDAVKAVGKVWVHWILYNIPPETTYIKENSIPKNSFVGKNDFNQISYGGPAPPDKEHTYIFKLFALNKILKTRKDITIDEINNQINNSIISQAKLSGRYSPQ